MKTNVCVNGQCQNTMKDYICVCNAGFRSDVTKKLCNGEKAYRVTFARRVGWGGGYAFIVALGIHYPRWRFGEIRYVRTLRTFF